ncbi:alkaline phosphatase family protein [Granulicella cerasi]|uniref:Alkaline phosphatase family protein n=1 Tax=Granulicella cerasi TaxID=741063 RepID=A0ABW1Z7I4_9BACT
MRGVIPTVTYPSHTTMVTGVWPNEHGILANTTFDPEYQHPGEWYWYFNALKVQTLYQAADAAGLKTSAIGWPVTVGAPIDYLIAEFGQSEETDTPQGAVLKPADIKSTIGVTTTADEDGDVKKTAWAIGIINTYNPNLTLVHLTNLDHQEHLHSPFSKEADDSVTTLDKQVGEIIDAEMKKNPDAKIVVVSDHGFVRVDHHVNLNAILANAGLIRLKPGKQPKGVSPIESWDAQAWESGGTAVIMLHDSNDAAMAKKVREVVAKMAENPEYGIHKIVEGPEVAKQGGTPNALCLIDFNPGWSASGAVRGAAVKDAPSTGTHGYLPEHPELRSTFMVMGEGVAAGRDLGVIDMRQIAPSVAKMLGVKLPAAKQPAVKYER